MVWLAGLHGLTVREERGRFICKAQATVKHRESSLWFLCLFYLYEETQCTNTIIFIPFLARIPNLLQMPFTAAATLLLSPSISISFHSSLFFLLKGPSLCCPMQQDQNRSQAEKPAALSVMFHGTVSPGSCSSSTGWFSNLFDTSAKTFLRD